MSTVFIRLPAPKNCIPPFKRVHSFPLFMFNNKYRKPLTGIFTVHVSYYTCVQLTSHGVFMQWQKIEMAKLLTQLPPPDSVTASVWHSPERQGISHMVRGRVLGYSCPWLSRDHYHVLPGSRTCPCYPWHIHSLSQSESSIQVAWSLSANQSPVP